jgi:glycosyltransferase involved in cell wall biosynthesis
MHRLFQRGHDMSVNLSIVVPLHNEEENVARLHAAIVSALDGREIAYELLLVDDGSSDRTYEQAVSRVREDARVRVIKLRRNYGQTAAMAAGIDQARGEVVVTMDGDLQNDPGDIPRLLAVLDEGYDLVAGWRRRRRDSGARVLVSRAANWIMARVMGVAIQDSGCSLKAFKASLIKGLPLYGEMHRFIPALSQLAGARVMEIEVHHRPRQFGRSKYGFSRIYKVMLDIISIRSLLSYAMHPFAWQNRLTVATIVAGAATFGYAMLEDGPTSPLLQGMILIFFSLGVFLIAWALLGLSIALFDAERLRYASLSAQLADRL